MIGNSFGSLTVIAPADRLGGRPAWHCRCQCGVERPFRGEDLRSGNSTSCGCKRRASLVRMKTTHGQTSTPLYNVWCAMVNRCHCPTSAGFYKYGARGVSVCQEWRDSFETFARDMGPRPPGLSIDRIDGSGNYEPGNCRWATAKEQSGNRRVTIWEEHDGRRLCAADWAREFNVSSKRLYRVMSEKRMGVIEACAYVRSRQRVRHSTTSKPKASK